MRYDSVTYLFVCFVSLQIKSSSVSLVQVQKCQTSKKSNFFLFLLLFFIKCQRKRKFKNIFLLTNREGSILDDKTIFPDLPNGPLTVYRQRATFNYKILALILESEESHRLKVNAI